MDGVLYLAMRYVDGVDLGVVIEHEQPMDMDFDRVCDLLDAVAGALDTAHGTGLVHRGIKPANILVAPAPQPGQPQQIYLCDFGIAKHSSVTRNPLTMTGQFLGTLQYCAPEQIQGGSIDGRADQYALACVAFHCLTGQVPFPRDEPAAARTPPNPQPAADADGWSACWCCSARSRSSTPPDRPGC